jgi:hypothetical protein
MSAGDAALGRRPNNLLQIRSKYMRSKWSAKVTFCVLAVPLAAPLYAQTAGAKPDDAHPCNAITSACKNAGFIDGGSKLGKGLWDECIEPLMHGTPQSKEAKLPLPQVSPQLVAACHAKEPTFGFPQKSKPKQ